MVQKTLIGNVVPDYLKDMNLTDEVCIKGKDSNIGFNASVASLKNVILPVVESHQNVRGTITLTLKEKDFRALARKHGYNV